MSETLAQWAKRNGPTDEVITTLRDAGWSQRRASRVVGMSQTGLSSRCIRRGIPWPDSSRTRIWMRGAYRTVAEAARMTGIDYSAMYYRAVILGWHGDKAMRRTGGHSRQPQDKYDTGLSVQDWHTVLCEVDEEAGRAPSRVTARKRVASRRHIPYGAIAAAERGEWERLG